MKSIRTLHLLSLLGFLLLIAPFYDQCNGHGMKKVQTTPEEIMADTTAIEDSGANKSNIPIQVKKKINIKKDSVSKNENNTPPFYQKVYELIDDENNQNAFELANMSREYFNITFQEFNKELFKNFKKHKYDDLSLLIRSFSFVFIVLISFSILILSLLKRVKWVCKLSFLNISLIVITLICILFFDSLFETYKQIKWGYYAFTLVQIGIYYASKLLIPKTKL